MSTFLTRTPCPPRSQPSNSRKRRNSTACARGPSTRRRLTHPRQRQLSRNSQPASIEDVRSVARFEIPLVLAVRRVPPHPPSPLASLGGADGLTADRTPDPQCLVSPGGHDPCAVRRHRTPIHCAGVAVEDAAGLTTERIPDPQRPVGRGGHDPAAVRRHRTTLHRLGMAGQCAPDSPVATSQIRNVVSFEADTIQSPSGATAQPPTQLVWPDRVRRDSPVATSQIRNVR